MIHVLCKCGEWALVGRGHPAVRERPDGTHEIHDRSALLPGCACPEDGAGSRPLTFTLMAG